MGLVCTFAGHNTDELDWEKVVRMVAIAMSTVLIIFSLAFGLQWAPMEIPDPIRWCWLRQVYSPEHFGDNQVHCVRCDGQACIDKWSQTRNMLVTASLCFGDLGGFAVSER